MTAPRKHAEIYHAACRGAVAVAAQGTANLGNAPMSALGQKRTLGHLRAMSALPPKADIALHRSECPLCAKSRHSALQQKALLFDHLVGQDAQRLRDRQAERFRSFKIDGQVKFGRLLDRQIGGTGTFQDFINVRCGAPI